MTAPVTIVGAGAQADMIKNLTVGRPTRPVVLVAPPLLVGMCSSTPHPGGVFGTSLVTWTIAILLGPVVIVAQRQLVRCSSATARTPWWRWPTSTCPSTGR
jgi:hypothetical protein